MNLEIMAKLNTFPEIKNKEFFTITDVFKLTNINTHTLRYWEKNGLITPIRVHNGQRRYNQEHLNLIFRLKELIYDEKIGIKGARKIIKSKAKKIATDKFGDKSQQNDDIRIFIDDIKKELKSIAKLLK